MNSKMVHLARIFNYLIFANEPVSIYRDPDELEKVLFKVLDHEGTQLKARLLFVQDYKKVDQWSPSIRLTALVRYNACALKFEVTLDSSVQQENVGEMEFYFSVPDEAAIIDRRIHKRFKIAHRSHQFQVTLRDLSGNILASPGATEIHDISSAGVTVWCRTNDINQERVLNGRIIIRIESHGEKILENNGHANLRSGKNKSGRILISIVFDRNESVATGKSKRLFQRVDLNAGAPTYALFHYPFTPEQRLAGYIADLSEKGAKLVLRQNEKPVPPGLTLKNIEIQMPYREIIHVDGEVAYTRSGSVTAGCEQTIGIRFDAPRKDLQDILLSIERNTSPACDIADFSGKTFIKADENISIRISLTMQGNSRWLISQDQIEFSHDSLRFTLSRSAGQLFPRQFLREISIYKNKLLIARCTGTVETADFSGNKWLQNRCFTVTVRLTPSKLNDGKEEVRINRARDRVLMIKENALTYIQSDHPLCHSHLLHGHLIDISIQGMSFYVFDQSVPLFPGLLLPNLSIRFPLRQCVAVDFIVTSCTCSEANHRHGYRIGGRFETLSVKARNTITIAIQQGINEYIHDWSEDDFNRLWEFYFESGFIYSKKRRQIYSYGHKITDTYRKLLTHDNPIIKVFLYKQKGDIKGHLSAVHFFDHAWMVQHLMAAKGESGSTAKAVLDPMIDFFDDLYTEHPEEQNYIFFFYREDNTFPAIVFGNIREKAADKNISDSIEFDFCLPKRYDNRSVDRIDRQGIPICREADSSDLERLEMLILSEGSIPLFQLEGLDKESICNLSVESEYARLGLFRFRKVFTAEDASTGARCFAVANYSSPGINFSELNNFFRIYYENKNDKSSPRLADKLSMHVLESYVKLGVTKPVLLCGIDQPVVPIFEKTKRYKYFFCNMSHMALIKSVTANSIDCLKQNIRMRRLKLLTQD